MENYLTKSVKVQHIYTLWPTSCNSRLSTQEKMCNFVHKNICSCIINICNSPKLGVAKCSLPLEIICTCAYTCSGILYRSAQKSFSVICSVTQSCPNLRPHELQNTRPPCTSPTPRVHSNSHPLSRWCHPAISSSVVPFSSCPQSFPDQSLFQWVNSPHEVAKVLEFQLQHQSFQRTPRADLL